VPLSLHTTPGQPRMLVSHQKARRNESVESVVWCGVV
jgi:hypothetical protein